MATRTALCKITPLLVTALLAAGCVTPMPTQHQAGVGRVAVIAPPHQPDVKLEGLGSGELAAHGLHCLAPLYALFIPPAAVALSLACLAVAGTASAAAPRGEDLQAAEADQRAKLGSQAIQESLRNQVAAAMHGRGMRMAGIPLERAQRMAQSRDYRPLATEGIDTVIETTLVRVGTRSMGSRTPFEMLSDPPLLLFMQARVRLIRTADNAELLSKEVEYHGRRRRHSEWVAVGKEIAIEMEAGYPPLGAYISDTVFLLYSLPDQNTLLPGVEFGLGRVGPGTLFGYIDTLRPTMQWERFPRDSDLKWSPEEMARVKDVTYDLIVAEAEYGAPATVVYRREGVSGSAHQLETALSPGKHYFWTVRARFQLDGRERVIEWASVRHGEMNFGPVAPPAFGYQFRTKPPR